MMRPLALLLLVPLAAPCLAQETADNEDALSPLVGAAWCVVLPAEARSEEPEEGALGCDGGVGAALWRNGRLAVVAVVGAQSAGGGLAYILNPGRGRPVALAVGVVVPWDTAGIYTEPSVAAGITISWRGAPE